MKSIGKVVHAFGIKISLVNEHDILNFFTVCIDSRLQGVLASLNMHGIYMHSKSAIFRELHNSPDTMVHIDGMPIVWMINSLGISRDAVRTGWIDWVDRLFEKAEKNQWRIYYLGSREDVALRGIVSIREKFKDLIISGRSGFFDKTTAGRENAAIINEINTYKADILIVGMGMGVQEEWIQENKFSLNVPVIATSGACMEILSGDLSVPPLFFRRFGMEWLYRLCKTPRRVYKRYLIEPFFVALYLISKGFRK